MTGEKGGEGASIAPLKEDIKQLLVEKQSESPLNVRPAIISLDL